MLVLEVDYLAVFVVLVEQAQVVHLGVYIAKGYRIKLIGYYIMLRRYYNDKFNCFL